MKFCLKKMILIFGKNSKHKSLRHLDIEDEGRVQYDFVKDIAMWKEKPEKEEDDIEEESDDDSIDIFL